MEKNIYLLKGGISCDDIKKSLTEIIKDKSQLNSLKKSMEINNNLTNNGAYEILMLKKNQKLKNIFDEKTMVFTSADDIETAMIFASNFNIGGIYPILNLSDKKSLKKLRDVKDFKNYYGKPNNISKYWDVDFNLKKLDLELLNIKNNLPKISWKYFDGKYLSDYRRFSFSRFLNFLKEIMDTNVQYKTVVFIGNNRFINDFLKKSKIQQFDKKKDLIEYSSIYELNIKLEKKVLLDSFEKIYPNKHNFYPLSISNDNNFKYSYNNKSFKLINSNENIPKILLYKYNFSRCFDKSKINKLKEELKNNNNKNNNKINNDPNFEKLIKIINK